MLASVASKGLAAGPGPGTITALITDGTKLPVAHATVTAVRAGRGAIRATVSGSDGGYSFADLVNRRRGLTSVASNVDHGRMQQPPDPHREMPVRPWSAFGAG